MSVPRHDHLLEQAENLISTATGRVRQVDLRRAISTAYYALFHYLAAAMADEFVGSTQRQTPRYALIYRGVGHRALRDLCLEVKKTTSSPRYAASAPADGFGSDLLFVARAAIELQERRHQADYDPLPRFKRLDASLAIVTAGKAIESFERADLDRQRTFLTLMLCSPR